MENQFINTFPFTKEAATYIKQKYKIYPEELETKYKNELDSAINSLIIIINNKTLDIEQKFEHVLIFLIMQMFVTIVNSTNLYEIFTEVYRKHTINNLNAMISIDHTLKDTILKLCRNTFTITIEAGTYIPKLSCYEFPRLFREKEPYRSKSEWRIAWHDYTKILYETGIETEKSWKLLEQEIHSGFVYLRTRRVIQYIGYKVKQYMKSKYIPWLEKGLPDEKDRAEELHKMRKEHLAYPLIQACAAQVQKELEKFVSPTQIILDEPEIRLDLYPPCIKNIISALQNGVNVDNNSRLILAIFLLNLRVPTQQIANLFIKTPDFDRDKTMYHIEYAKKRGYTSFGCAKIRSFNLCRAADDDANLCGNSKINIKNPLSYVHFKKKSIKK